MNQLSGASHPTAIDALALSMNHITSHDQHNIPTSFQRKNIAGGVRGGLLKQSIFFGRRDPFFIFFFFFQCRIF
jgi:hypothetical protein